MKLDNKTVIIGVVLLVVVGIVTFNLEKFTGKATATKYIPPKVFLSANPQITNQENSIVKAGSKVYVTVETGSKGIRRNGYIYDNNGVNPLRRADVEFDQNCGGSVCRPNKVTWADYRTSTSWKGEYCVKVAELNTNTLVGKCFTIQ